MIAGMFAKRQNKPIKPGGLTSVMVVTTIGLTLLAGLLPYNQPVPVNAQGSSAYDLIAAVNSLRAANGLPALETNNKLMSITQAHSDYQASIGSVTHSGAGGSRPRDRAADAGYGGGGTFFISENIAGGSNLTAEQAVGWWQGDAPHLNTMLGNSYAEVGAGAAVSGSTVYYTLDVAYVAGSSSGSSGNTSGATQATPLPGSLPLGPTATLEIMMPIQVATPAADGAIIHVVEQGQFLITIAEVYKISLADLFRLNNLTDQSVIYPGEKLLIKVADRTPEPTPIETVEPTTPPAPTPTPTRRPTHTPRPTRTEVNALALNSDSNQSVNTPTRLSDQGMASLSQIKTLDPMLILIGGLFTFGALMILFGTLFKRRA